MKKIFIISIFFLLTACTNINTSNYSIKELKDTYNNDDIIGRITIAGTSINNPILKTTDNKYYLNHNINKKEDKKGEIFLDYRVNINDKKIIIYGHNSKNYKIPFKELEKYEKESFFLNNPYITIETETTIYTYEIFSIFIEDKDFSYMNIKYNEEEYLKHLHYLKEKSWYQKDIDLSKEDKILILQTCSYNKKYTAKNKYLLIVAKLL